MKNEAETTHHMATWETRRFGDHVITRLINSIDTLTVIHDELGYQVKALTPFLYSAEKLISVYDNIDAYSTKSQEEIILLATRSMLQASDLVKQLQRETASTGDLASTAIA